MSQQLRVDVPLSLAPPIEQAACFIWLVDRKRKLGVKALRRAFGRSRVQYALAQPGQWLVGVLGRASAGVCTLATEQDVIEAHRTLLQLHGAGHVEVFHWLSPDLRGRVVADFQHHTLRLAPVAGRA